MITIQSELVTAIKGALGTPATITDALCAEFIQRAEAKINRRLRAVDQETKTTSFSINAEFVNVPTSFLAVRSFQTTANGARYALRLIGQEQMINRYTSGTAPPKYYAVVGGQFRFAPIPDATYTATLIYFVSLTALGTTGANFNWLLTAHPDVYLYGALLEAEAYVQDDPRLAIWKSGFDEGIEQVKRAHDDNRWSGPGLAISPG